MNGYLLDTNVLSETSREFAHPSVLQFLESNRNIWVSAIVFEEFYYGMELLPEGRRRDRLSDWLDRTLVSFENRLLTIGLREAEWSGRFRARARRRGYEMTHPDALIAATAASHDLCLATRNVRDFRILDIPILNPWEET